MRGRLGQSRTHLLVVLPGKRGMRGFEEKRTNETHGPAVYKYIISIADPARGLLVHVNPSQNPDMHTFGCEREDYREKTEEDSRSSLVWKSPRTSPRRLDMCILASLSKTPESRILVPLVKHLVSLLVYIHAAVLYILTYGIIWSWGSEHEKSYIPRHPP